MNKSTHCKTTTKTEDQMNGTEAAYAQHLELLKRAGHILRYDFTPEKFRLADRTFYTPDFRVVKPDGQVEFHEVKGFMRDDAAVKIKVAAEMHPYVFQLVKKVKKDWKIEEV